MLERLIFNLLQAACIALVKQDEEAIRDGSYKGFLCIEHYNAAHDFLDRAECFAAYGIMIPPMRQWLHYS